MNGIVSDSYTHLNFKYLYLEGITNAKFDFVEAEGESWLIDDLRKLEVKDEAN